jgi:hypothetical protein
MYPYSPFVRGYSNAHYYRSFVRPELPSVQKFKQSAQSFIVPSKELQALLDKIAHDAAFASQLMDAAKVSQQEKVNSLIKSAGIYTPFQVNFNPDGIKVIFTPQDASACFAIILSLCWR